MATKKKVEDLTAEAQKTMEQGVEKMTKGMEDAASFSKDNMEAVVASSKRAAKAAEEMNAEIAAYAKKSYEDSMAAAKEFTGCKSMTDLFEMQTAFAKASFDAYVAEATKLNEMATSAAKDCFEPITGRFEAATEMFKSTHA